MLVNQEMIALATAALAFGVVAFMYHYEKAKLAAKKYQVQPVVVYCQK